jgi:RNA 2',3'-cyclic 3'-phosphodiesterase
MRCFVACCPDDATRARLERITGAVIGRYPGARRVRADNLHLTLAFIGELALPAARAAALAVGAIQSEPFPWCIDRVGRFDRARVLWAGGADEPRLTDLAERVRSCLQTLRIRFDAKPFAAHVTLLRDLPSRRHDGGDAVEAIDPFAWPIRTAQMMVSERDAQGSTRYRELGAG